MFYYRICMDKQKRTANFFALSSRSWITCRTNKKARGVPRASSLSRCPAMCFEIFQVSNSAFDKLKR